MDHEARDAEAYIEILGVDLNKSLDKVGLCLKQAEEHLKAYFLMLYEEGITFHENDMLRMHLRTVRMDTEWMNEIKQKVKEREETNCDG